MKKILIKLMPFLVFMMLVVPVLSFAQVTGPAPAARGGTSGNIIPCGTDATQQKQCDFNDVLKLINNVVYFILVYLSVPIAAIMFAYAGIMLVTAGEHSEHARTEAKEIFINTVIGVCFVAGSWIIIHSISELLGYDGAWIGF